MRGKTRGDRVAVLSLSVLFFSALLMASCSPREKQGLIACWKFDEAKGDRLLDTSGNGNHGTIHGATWAKGRVNGGLRFDGVDDYVEVPKSASLDSITGEITLMCWIKTPLTGRHSILERWLWDGSHQRRLELDVNSEGKLVRFAVSRDGVYGTWHQRPGAIPANKWVHIAATSDGRAMRIYVNGHPDPYPSAPDAPGIHQSTAADLHIGAWNSGVKWGFFFKGIMDEIRIYSRALTHEEILRDYKAGGPIGTVAGRIIDTNGKPIKGAEVSAGPFRTITDKQGRYSITVPARPYDVKASRKGYRIGIRPDTKVKEGETAKADVTLAEDKTPPIVKGLKVKDIDSVSAAVVWKTNETCSSRIKYGTSSRKYDKTLKSPSRVKTHRLALTGLTSGTEYYFVVESTDEAQNAAISKERTFSTRKKCILTPKPSPKPRINGARVFGVRPGSPFLFSIPATGVRPMRFAAGNLPDGLKLDKSTGRITGKVKQAGTYNVTLRAKNKLGEVKRKFRIVVGEKICLTPPMGWNSWNCWTGTVDDKKVRAAAKVMAEKLKNHGWTYVNIDDAWQGRRGGRLNAIQPNKKFPDMKGLCNYVHGLGLKVGIYSTPWITSYDKYVGGSSDNRDGTWLISKQGVVKRRKHWRFGNYSFAKNDVKQWAAWGIDYLKYDWAPNDIPHVKEMSDALRASGRDIVFSITNSAPYDKASELARLCECWRQTGDIRDNWNNMAKIAFGQNRWQKFVGPGHWNDADMLVVGRVEWRMKLPRPSRLTPDEQYTHISMWCLLASPLLLGCDLAALDDFTLSLLTNDEVLEVNQDPLGRQAGRVMEDGDGEVWAKDMEDGSKAAGLFNRGSTEAKVCIQWSKLGIKGPHTVRDLWRQKDLGVFKDRFEANVPSHGVVLVRMVPVKTK